jgi:hypothetical protein
MLFLHLTDEAFQPLEPLPHPRHLLPHFPDRTEPLQRGFHQPVEARVHLLHPAGHEPVPVPQNVVEELWRQTRPTALQDHLR